MEQYTIQLKEVATLLWNFLLWSFAAITLLSLITFWAKNNYKIASYIFNGQVRTEKLSSNEELEIKNAKNGHHSPQRTRCSSKYPISRSGIWVFCKFLASFLLENDVTDAILKDYERIKVQYLGSLLFDLFEFCRMLTFSKGIHLISNFVAMATKIKMMVYYWNNKKSIV